MKYHGDSNPYNVDALWEVRVRPELLKDIQTAAQRYNTTMSWVVRYCAFRLFRLKKVSLAKLHRMAEDLREKNQKNPTRAKDLHRLRVCLYGEDEQIFLELKYRFRLTTTMLVRIALQIYLKYLLSGAETNHNLFYYGLKFYAKAKLRYSYRGKVPQVDFHFKEFFQLSAYWDIPGDPLPTFIRV